MNKGKLVESIIKVAAGIRRRQAAVPTVPGRQSTYQMASGRKYKPMATGKLRNDKKLQEWDSILGDTRTDNEVYAASTAKIGRDPRISDYADRLARMSSGEFNNYQNNLASISSREKTDMARANDQMQAREQEMANWKNNADPRNPGVWTAGQKARNQAALNRAQTGAAGKAYRQQVAQMRQSGSGVLGSLPRGATVVRRGKDGNYYKLEHTQDGRRFRTQVANSKGDALNGAKRYARIAGPNGGFTWKAASADVRKAYVKAVVKRAFAV